jgi:hypothetical protein
MEQTRKTNKVLDLAIGFIGWEIFNFLNFIFYYVLAFSGALVALPGFGHYSDLVYMGLPTVIVLLIFFAKKRIWIGIGIVVAVTINVALWAILGAEPNYYFYPIWEAIRMGYLF